MSSLNDIYNSHASLGRFGDTKMRMVDGVPSHVNPEEARVIDMYGSQGEELVKALGSGTINPNTGYPEYDIAGAVFSWFMGSLSESAQGATEADKAEITADVATKKSAKLTEALAELRGPEGAIEKGKEFRIAGYGESADELSFGAGMSAEKNLNVGRQQATKSNLVYGTAQKSVERSREMLHEKVGLKSKALWGNLQQSLGEFEFQMAEKEFALESGIAAEDANKRLAEKTAESWYPWKNIRKVAGV